VWSQTDKRLLCTENVTPKRQNIAKEIHETEVSYLNGLVQVIEVCISHPGLLAVFCFVSIHGHLPSDQRSRVLLPRNFTHVPRGSFCGITESFYQGNRSRRLPKRNLA
jgi:hypothetical protein